MDKRKNGFTLIELIAVLVILTIIALIVIPLLLNVVKKAKASVNKRSVDAYGKSVELAIANYMQKKRDYPSSFENLEVEYTGKDVNCKIIIINDDVDGSIYLSGCSVGGVEVLDSSTVDGYYHYGKEGVNNKYYVSTYGLFVEKAIDDYIKKNNTIPSNLEDLTINYNEKNVVCNKFEMTSEKNFFISECSVDGTIVEDLKTDDGYYHYGKSVSNGKLYKVGDAITYKGMNFYVIKNSDETQDYVTLLKAEALTTDEVNTYGVGHINMYNSRSTSTSYQQVNDQNGYGGIVYYSSSTCGYNGSSWVYTGCTTDYNQSEIKYVVDAWMKSFEDDLVIDSMGYKARLITIDDLVNNLNFKNYSGAIVVTSSVSEEILDWLYNDSYSYWTMTVYKENKMYLINSYGISNYGDVYSSSSLTIRPVINLNKSAITE